MEGASPFLNPAHSSLPLPASASRSCLWSQGTPANCAEAETAPEHRRQRKKTWIIPAISMIYVCHLNFKEQTTEPTPPTKGYKGRKQQIHRARGCTTIAMDPQRALGPTQALFPDISSRQEDLPLLALKIPPPVVISSSIRQVQKFNLLCFSSKDG